MSNKEENRKEIYIGNLYRKADQPSFEKKLSFESLTPNFQENDTCLTIFGYKPSQCTDCLVELRKYGNIIDYQEKGKNFMHVRFSTFKEAESVLKLHGLYIENMGIILGVKKCEDTEFLMKNKNFARIQKSPIKEQIVKNYKYQALRPEYTEHKGLFRQIIEHILCFIKSIQFLVK